MIFYIAIYKCVQRRKYINGFSQRGSMHELFFEDGGGVGDTICRCTFPKSNQTISVNAEYMCWLRLLFLFVCLFFRFLLVSPRPSNHVPRKHHRQSKDTG